MNRKYQKGSIVAYLLIAIFLIGVLIVTMTQGTKKNPLTQQLDNTVSQMESDLAMIEAAASDCVLVYPTPVDRDNDGDKDTTDNANAPFPVYGDLSSGGATGDEIADIKCLGAPTAKQLIFSNSSGRGFRLLGNTTTWTTTYLSNTTEGVLIKVLRTASSPLWTESLDRLNAKYSTCKAAKDTAGGCANGCFYYWIKRLPGSVIAVEGGCP